MLLLGTFLTAALISAVPVLPIPFPSAATKSAALLTNGYPSLSPLSSTNPTPEWPLCLGNELDLNLTAVAEDCSTILNDTLLRLDGIFEKRVFFHKMYMDSSGSWVPARWAFGQCVIQVGSWQLVLADQFTIFEVALSANKILADCVTSQRKGQGGWIPIGSPERFFQVDLEGQRTDMNVVAIDDTKLSALFNVEDAKRTLDAKRVHSAAAPQQRKFEPSGALRVADQELSTLSSRGNTNTWIDHEVDCFPPGATLPDAVADDCMFIINSIIVTMKDPFRVQTWGFTDDVDINLSLPRYKWIHKNCLMRVKNIDEKQVDRFRPVDVAEVAQRIVQACIVETKSPLGGTCDLGHLEVPLSFYVAVSGTTRTSGQSLGNSTVLSLPSDGPLTLERRTPQKSPQESTVSNVPTEGLENDEPYPVHCFDPSVVHRLKRAVASDCAIVIDEIILRLPNPMLEQTFGYTDAADINLSKPEYNHWAYGQCAIFVRNTVKTTQGRFRFVDVAFAAQRIIQQCVEGSKHGIGGTSNIGTNDYNFYVGVGGVGGPDVLNGTALESAFNILLPSPPGASSGLISSSQYNSTESADLQKRSSNITSLLQYNGNFAPTVGCIQHGMPAAQEVELQDCSNAATELLSEPNILLPQSFTTESTGGIRMPFVHRNRSCYLMLDTKSDLSISVSIPLLKMVYWALEIMLKCVVGREKAFGGVSRMYDDREIFVSVTGVDPTFLGGELASLLDGSSSAV